MRCQIIPHKVFGFFTPVNDYHHRAKINEMREKFNKYLEEKKEEKNELTEEQIIAIDRMFYATYPGIIDWNSLGIAISPPDNEFVWDLESNDKWLKEDKNEKKTTD